MGKVFSFRLCGVLICVLMSLMSAAQTMTYYVQLADKNGTPYTISKPEAFLSPKAIERRHRDHIALQQNDLPVSQSYVQRIAGLCDIKYALKWTNAVVVTSDDTSVMQRLRSLPFVSGVKIISHGGPSTVHKALDAPAAPPQRATADLDSTFYGAATRQSMMIHINKVHEKGYWGDGVLIAMMDAGFLNANNDPYAKTTFDSGRVLYTWNFVFNNADVYNAPQADPHGGETFSCIASNKPYDMVGTAPNADFLLFQTEDERSETIVEEYNWAAAAERADSMGAEVFSTSLGYTTFDNSDSADSHTYADMTGHTTPIAIAVNTAASKGILVINSAGNEGANSWHYVATPGDADSGVTIGAVKPSAEIADFSSRGPNSSGQIKPDVCAQGNPAALIDRSGNKISASGTSFSCPITAGAFACLRGAFPTASSGAIINAVRQSCSQYSHPDNNYGYGIPDFGDAYDRLKILYPDDTLSYVTSARVYPNPFTTALRIIMTGLLHEPVNTAELYDMSGQKVYSASIPTSTLVNNIWDIAPPANLSQGVYILSINKSKKFRLLRR